MSRTASPTSATAPRLPSGARKVGAPARRPRAATRLPARRARCRGSFRAAGRHGELRRPSCAALTSISTRKAKQSARRDARRAGAEPRRRRRPRRARAAAARDASSRSSRNSPSASSPSASVPRATTAAGVRGSLPCAIRPSTIRSTWRRPMKKTSVPGRLRELRVVEVLARRRMPADERHLCGDSAMRDRDVERGGTEASADTPGTTSNGTPASASACASSPPRPKTNGSPPFRRTVSSPSRPSSTSSSLSDSWSSACARDQQRVVRRLGDELRCDERVVDERLAARGRARARAP